MVAPPAPARPAYPPVASRRRIARWPIVVAVAGALVGIGGVAAFAVLRGGEDGDLPAGREGSSAAVAMQTATLAPATETPSPAGAAAPAATPSPTLTPTPTPGPASTPTPRNVNGLLVVDEAWVGRVVEPGGLRIRRAPRVEPGNVVGSVPTGAEVQVQGRVLNGQEAEPGKGTVWLIVGPNQYIYGAPGYVERIR